MTAARLALAWVRLYSRGLTPDARAARYAEVESDLWEHQAACGRGPLTQLAMVSRSARGVPADLAWRASARTTRVWAALPRVGGWCACLLAFLQLVGFHVWSSTALLGLDLYGEDWPQDDVLRQAEFSSTLGFLLVAGALALPRMPRVGAALVLASSLGSVLAFPYLAPVFVPAALAVSVGAIVLARRRRSSGALGPPRLRSQT